MSLVIDLPADVESRLEQEAARQGKAPQEVAQSLIEEALKPRTGAELVAWLRAKGALGIFQDRPDDWAQRLREESNTRGRSRA